MTFCAKPLSASWQECKRISGRAGEDRVDAAAQPKWEVVSGSSSYAWIEPHAMHPDEEPKGAGQTKEFQWEIPVQIGDQRMVVYPPSDSAC